jgi:hypothetical protein
VKAQTLSTGRSLFTRPPNHHDKITIQIQRNRMSNTEIEARLFALETEVARLKAQQQTSVETPWWKEILGSFANDPAYDEAMQLGREYRESLRLQAESTSTP